MTLLRFITVSLAVITCSGMGYPETASAEVRFSQEQICKAAIGTIMGRDPKTVKVTKMKSRVAYL